MRTGMGSSESFTSDSRRTSTDPYGTRGQDFLGNRFWRSRTLATEEEEEKGERKGIGEELLDGS